VAVSYPAILQSAVERPLLLYAALVREAEVWGRVAEAWDDESG
jgi:hypothetical protein